MRVGIVWTFLSSSILLSFSLFRRWPDIDWNMSQRAVKPPQKPNKPNPVVSGMRKPVYGCYHIYSKFHRALNLLAFCERIMYWSQRLLTLTPSCFSQTERLTSLSNVETETAALRRWITPTSPKRSLWEKQDGVNVRRFCDHYMVCPQNARMLSARWNLKEIESAVEKKLKKSVTSFPRETTSEKAVLLISYSNTFLYETLE